MTSIREAVRRLFIPVQHLPAGNYAYQSPPDAPAPFRMHLRLEDSGEGLLILNASTVLHLNQTAAEFVYHWIAGTPSRQAARMVASRYRVNQQQAAQDFQDLKDRIQTMLDTPDLDPEMYLNLERTHPYEHNITAPYRLDCAITYQLPPTANPTFAPLKNVERELTTTEWFSIIDTAWRVGIPHLIFTGGEPTLREDLPELIAHAQANGQVTGLLTDGVKFAEPDYLQRMLQTGLDHMLVLVQSAEPLFWEAVENLAAADIFLTAHLTLTFQNVIQAPDVLKRLAKLGVNAISLTASDPNLQSSLGELRDKAADMGLSLVWDLPVPYSSVNPVAIEVQAEAPVQGAGKAWLYVEPDGDVRPAQGVDHVLGNLLIDAWDKIWQ